MTKAKGEPWQIMYVNVARRLERCRGLYQLPLTIDEVARPCFPGPDIMKTEGEEWDNLRRSMFLAGTVTFTIDGETFWVMNHTDTAYPTPVIRTSGIVIPQAHPRRSDILKWVDGAAECEQEIEEGKMYVNRTMRMLKHPKWVEEYWPDIVPYVGSVPETMVRLLREPRPSALNLDTTLQVRIVELLTLASLLQEDDLHAWVGAPQ